MNAGKSGRKHLLVGEQIVVRLPGDRSPDDGAYFVKVQILSVGDWKGDRILTLAPIESLGGLDLEGVDFPFCMEEGDAVEEDRWYNEMVQLHG